MQSNLWLHEVKEETEEAAIPNVIANGEDSAGHMTLGRNCFGETVIGLRAFLLWP